ncbi:hypothetical protein [Pseudonocardia ammonioxydans]|uniref:hypothetical protein n=1 Tax=Pseudonocardia ammonioxydans TaxID=260086 RepID=UPI000B89A539|nr:hypothetical protein [Pseudonocardia ammonioxydans]
MGRRRYGTRLAGRYIDRVLVAAARDAEFGRAFVRVSGLVDPPGTLRWVAMAPGVARRRECRSTRVAVVGRSHPDRGTRGGRARGR